MGRNLKFLSTFSDKPQAYMQNNTNKILGDNLYALHKAREAFMANKNLEINCCVLKGCVRYTFASLFLSLNESTCQTRKNIFYFTSKALLTSNFRILHFQIS